MPGSSLDTPICPFFLKKIVQNHSGDSTKGNHIRNNNNWIQKVGFKAEYICKYYIRSAAVMEMFLDNVTIFLIMFESNNI